MDNKTLITKLLADKTVQQGLELFIKTKSLFDLLDIEINPFDRYVKKYIHIDSLTNGLNENQIFNLKNRIFEFIINHRDDKKDIELNAIAGDNNNFILEGENKKFYVFYNIGSEPRVTVTSSKTDAFEIMRKKPSLLIGY